MPPPAFALIALCVGLLACDTAPAPPVSSQPVDGFPRALAQPNGEALTIPRKPERIVSATLATDEILLDLVDPKRILALSVFADEPEYSNVVEKAKAVEKRVAGHAEQVVALAPDLIFVASYSKPEFLRMLKGAGLPVFQLQFFDSIDQILGNVETVGQAVGEEARAKALVDQARPRIEAVSKAAEGKPRPLILSYSHGFVAGKNTTINDMIVAAGGANYAAEKGIEGNQEIALEVLLTWQPQWLLLQGQEARRGEAQAALNENPSLGALQAVRENRVIVMPGRRLSPVSHYIADGIEELARLLNP
ncbi:MAG: ABC transporter substrate-binding protein [Candidatus Sumerlaeota bacterium]|nr:ABC transporter substrate-binding protein [Candidatus Sumerlaeota bacterium]